MSTPKLQQPATVRRRPAAVITDSQVLATLAVQVENLGKVFDQVSKDIRELRSEARGDFRTLIAWIAGAAVGLASLIARGFHWL